MRRSTVVTLTLLPMLAAAAVASADDDPPQDPDVTVPADMPLAPPGMTEPSFRPPGLVPIHEDGVMQLDCSVDPDWRLRDDCITNVGYLSIYRGGFGSYFWVGGG